MRSLVLALALCCTLTQVSTAAAYRTVKVKAKRNKFKPQKLHKPKTVKRHTRHAN